MKQRLFSPTWDLNVLRDRPLQIFWLLSQVQPSVWLRLDSEAEHHALPMNLLRLGREALSIEGWSRRLMPMMKSSQLAANLLQTSQLLAEHSKQYNSMILSFITWLPSWCFSGVYNHHILFQYISRSCYVLSVVFRDWEEMRASLFQESLRTAFLPLLSVRKVYIILEWILTTF